MISRVLLRRTLVLPILFAALAACGDDDDDNGTGIGTGTFTLGAPSGTTTIAAGSTAQVTLPVTASGNFAAVTLVADSVPVGISVGFAPATIVSGVEQTTVSVNVDPSKAAGTYTFKVIARATGMTDQVQRVTVTTTALPSYTITNTTSAAARVQIQRTQSGTVTINLARLGFTGPVEIVPDALPAGITVPVVSNITGNSATITINTAANATATTGSFVVRSLNPSMSDRTTTIFYQVLAEPGVQVSAPGSVVTVRGLPSYTVPVTVNREGGFTGPVTVTLSNLPTGVTAAPVTSAAGSTVNVPLTIAGSAPASTTTITASVSGAGIATKTATTSLRVQSTVLASGVAVTAIADSSARGAEALFTITVPAGATRIVVTTSGSGSAAEDVDLYLVRPNGTVACASELAGNAETCTVNSPVDGVWEVVLGLWTPYSNVTLTATITSTDPALEPSVVQVQVQQVNPAKAVIRGGEFKRQQ